MNAITQEKAKEAFGAAVKRNSKIDAAKAYQIWKNVSVHVAVKYVNENWPVLRLLHY